MGDNEDEDVRKIMPIEKTTEVLNMITIPSILVSKKDADNFKKVLDNSEPSERMIVFAINFSLTKRNSKANLKMILQTDDFRSYETIVAFYPYYKKFQENIDLKVHYKLFKNLPFLTEDQNCIEKLNNKYCVSVTQDPKKTQGILDETLRQMCLIDNSFDQYVDYMKYVRKSCFEKEGNVVNEFASCAKKVYESNVASEIREKVSKCENPKNNEILELLEENNEKIKYNLINYSPLILINGYFYKGNYQDTHHLTEAFCNSFEEPPSGCEKLEVFQQWSDYSSASIMKFIVLSLLYGGVFVFLTITIFYVMYKRQLNTKAPVEINQKINDALSKYYPTERQEYQGVQSEL